MSGGNQTLRESVWLNLNFDVRIPSRNKRDILMSKQYNKQQPKASLNKMWYLTVTIFFMMAFFTGSFWTIFFLGIIIIFIGNILDEFKENLSSIWKNRINITKTWSDNGFEKDLEISKFNIPEVFEKLEQHIFNNLAKSHKCAHAFFAKKICQLGSDKNQPEWLTFPICKKIAFEYHKKFDTLFYAAENRLGESEIMRVLESSEVMEFQEFVKNKWNKSYD